MYVGSTLYWNSYIPPFQCCTILGLVSCSRAVQCMLNTIIVAHAHHQFFRVCFSENRIVQPDQCVCSNRSEFGHFRWCLDSWCVVGVLHMYRHRQTSWYRLEIFQFLCVQSIFSCENLFSFPKRTLISLSELGNWQVLHYNILASGLAQQAKLLS